MKPPIDRRTEERDQCNETLTVTLLDTPATSLSCTGANRSDGGLNVGLPVEVRPGTLLKVEGRDHLLLGEVVWSRPSGDSFATGIKVVHSIGNLAALARLNRELLKHSESERAPLQSLETQLPNRT
jgi:hypothetical protein